MNKKVGAGETAAAAFFCGELLMRLPFSVLIIHLMDNRSADWFGKDTIVA
ncbi:MAG: hypothetical protein WA112_05565 [Rugosibacter sp.]